MNLYTSNFKFIKSPIIRSLVTTLFLLSIYHILVVTKIVKPLNGLHQWENNLIRVQRYAYHNSSNLNIVLVGSSLTENIPTSYIDSHVINLGMGGGCAQTGIEAVRRKSSKPAILLIEINETIAIKTDTQMIDSIYNPFLYSIRLYSPMLRQEYQPATNFIPRFVPLLNKLLEANGVTNKTNKQRNSKPVVNVDSNLTDKLISQEVEANKNPLSEKEESVLREQAEIIRSQISQIRKNGVRVILFNVPGEGRIQNTVKQKQVRGLLGELFSINDFEWLPEPPLRQWATYDGIHLVNSDAKDYAIFIRNQLLPKKAHHKPIEKNNINIEPKH